MVRRRRVSASLACLALLVSACGQRDLEGSERRGLAAIDRYGCAACHTIPGVRDPRGIVGPPLAGIARRSYIGGVLPNDRDNLARFIINPRAYAPRTAMPVLGVTPQDGEDIARYLLTLK